MKKASIFGSTALCLGLGVLAGSSAFAAEYNPEFTDRNLYDCIRTTFVENIHGGEDYTDLTDMSASDFAEIEHLHCENKSIADLTGIEKLANLQELVLNHNNIAVADLSQNAKLETIRLNDNKLTSLIVPASAKTVTAEENETAGLKLDLSAATNLETLIIPFTKIVAPLDLSHNPNLDALYVYANGLSAVEISNNPKITELNMVVHALSTASPYDGDTFPSESEFPVFITSAKFTGITTQDTVAQDSQTGQDVVSTQAQFNQTLNITDIVTPKGFIDSSNLGETDEYTYTDETTNGKTTHVLKLKNPRAVQGYITVGPHKIFVPVNDPGYYDAAHINVPTEATPRPSDDETEGEKTTPTGTTTTGATTTDAPKTTTTTDAATGASEAEVDVPKTSTGKVEEPKKEEKKKEEKKEETKKENPDTSTASKLVLGFSFLGIAAVAVAIKAILKMRAKRA